MNGSNGYKSLIYAVRFPVLARLCGRLALVLAALCVPSLLVALWYGESAYLASFTPVIILLLTVYRLTRDIPEPRHLLRSEGFVITCSAFILTPLVMVGALWPSGAHLQDLLFETVSAVTTTGLSTFASVESLDKTVLFTRAWMQWYGGLGIVVLSVTLLMPRALASYQLLNISEEQGFVSSAIVYGKRILQVYVWLTVVAVVVCSLAIGDLFHGSIHALSAISTGGFSSYNQSLAGFTTAAQLAVILTGMAGAVSLVIYIYLWRRAYDPLINNQELMAFLLASIMLCLGLFLVHWQANGEAGESARVGVVMGLSALSTSGFANVALANVGQGGGSALVSTAIDHCHVCRWLYRFYCGGL